MPVVFKIKVVRVGNSLRITIPKEIAEALKLSEGDMVGISLTNNEFIVKKLSDSL
jgi:AbrB family looped-hinge helix DNA binding protein